ncbi:MAG: gamma-glutamylcyclotransferase [Alphaproteobacteria bacterium]|nr:gamma-glutamylcyclotransferase [Alphaproteobacteria bacterium]
MIQPSSPPPVNPLTRESLSADAVRQSIRDANPQIPVWSDAQLDESLTATLRMKPKQRDVWVFGYGSLLWNPILDVVQRRVGTVYGYRRRFCMVAPTGRGTRARPGLVLALDAGGCCQGVALKVNPKRIEEELSLLWRREMVVGSYTPKWITLHHAKGSQSALTFVMNRQHRSYRGSLTPAQTAKTIAHATGVLGSNAEYLFDTITHLNELGLGDKPLEDLATRVRRVHKRTRRR